jgi:hypothetical protein
LISACDLFLKLDYFVIFWCANRRGLATRR